jgi:AraC-like DNA-binding protein
MNKMNITYLQVMLGEVRIEKKLTAGQITALKEELQKEGFELIDEPRAKLIENVKQLIRSLIQNDEIDDKLVLSKVISGNLHHDYSYISNLFSSVEGQTIERYYIAQKIEKAKELLAYNELTLSEIAWKLGYSSVQHLSNQFKKVTGLTPSHFKSIGSVRRLPIDKV